MIIRHGISVILLATLSPFTAVAQGVDEARVQELVLETILANPEVVMQAVAILEQRQADVDETAKAEVLSNQRVMLERDPNAPVLGNPDGDVTVVEFFDYNCPYCKRAMVQVKGLIDADSDVRLVYREWPILGDGSVFASKAALAARKQGKYEEFHWTMMALKGRAEEASVLRVAKEVGLDIEQLRRDMEAPEVEEHIATSMRLSQSLGFNGTPSFVIGDALVPGYVEQSALAEYVSQARAASE